MLFLALIIILSILLLLLYDFSRRAKRLMKKIPGPNGYPMIGNTIHYILPPDKLFLYLRKICQEYGDFNQIHTFGKQAVNISNPQDVEFRENKCISFHTGSLFNCEIIMSSTKYSDKTEPYTFLKPWLGEGLLTSNGSKWHQRRKLLTKAFHFNVLKKYSRTFTEQTEVLIKNIHKETGKSKTDLLPLISSATLNIMCETAMGTTMDEGIESVTKKYFKAIHIVGEAVVERICRVWLYYESLFKWTNMAKIQQKALKDLHTFTNKIIMDRKEQLKNFDVNKYIDSDTDTYGSKGRLTMLDLLLENEKSGNIDYDDIREEVDTFMFEGHDTTAMALSYFIMAIANEPTVQEKIYEEMNNIFGKSQRLPTMSDLSEMKYLECCIKESLRLYPSVPFIARYLNEETVLSGYKVPANTYVHIFIYDLHRRPDLFTDPEQFIPERFLPQNCLNRHPYAYIPFSAGPRNCIGQKFAMLEMKTLISSLIRRFHIKPITKPSNLRFRADLVLRTTHPIYVQFRDRK